jgi:hypothetical protein
MTLPPTRYLPLSLLPPPRCALEAAHVLYSALHDAATSIDASGLGGPWPADPAHHDTIGRADDPDLARHAKVVRSTPVRFPPPEGASLFMRH